MRLWIPLLAVLALSGCDSAAPAEDDLALDVRGNAFTVGDEVEATVANTSDRAVYLYDCGGRILLDVQERGGAGWETVALVNGDCATARVVPYRLGAGDVQAVAFALDAPGTYRLKTAFGTRPGAGTDVGGADWVEAVSDPFRVGAGAP